MTLQCSIRLLVLAALGLGLLTARAEEGAIADEARVRAAVGKSLDFLAREGDAWMDERNCNACHHLPQLLWSQHAAARRGFAVDPAKFNETLAWAQERALDAKSGPEMAAFLRLALPEMPAPELMKLLASRQEADGSWKPGSQFASMQRREAQEAAGNAARLALLALAGDTMNAVARAKAAPFLAAAAAPKSVETLVFQMLHAQRFDDSKNAGALRAEILKLQRPDGGWAWMIGEAPSDPLATGEVLYALQQAHDTNSAAAISRARSWLLDRQRDDGSWAIDITRISRLDRSAPAKNKSLQEATGIYTFWGSAWATIALLEGLPVIELQAVPGVR